MMHRTHRADPFQLNRDSPLEDGSGTDSVSNGIKQLPAGDRSAAPKLWERSYRRLTALARCKLPRLSKWTLI